MAYVNMTRRGKGHEFFVDDVSDIDKLPTHQAAGRDGYSSVDTLVCPIGSTAIVATGEAFALFPEAGWQQVG